MRVLARARVHVCVHVRVYVHARTLYIPKVVYTCIVVTTWHKQTVHIYCLAEVAKKVHVYSQYTCYT